MADAAKGVGRVPIAARRDPPTETDGFIQLGLDVLAEAEAARAPMATTTAGPMTGTLAGPMTGTLTREDPGEEAEIDDAPTAADLLSEGPEADAPIVLEMHDRQQLEVQLAQQLSVSAGAETQATALELFFFIPRNVGTNGANYPRDEFYGDLTTFLRLDLPNTSLEELAAGSQSPLVKFRGHIDALRREYDPRPGGPGSPDGGPGVIARLGGRPAPAPALPRQQLAVEIKLFGHAFTEAVRQNSRALLSDLHRLHKKPAARRWRYLDEVDRFGEVARQALCALRGAARIFAPFGKAAPVASQVFEYTDEYCSLFFDRALSLIAQTAQEQPALFDGTGFVHRLRHTLSRHARAEAAYRAQMGYLNLTDTRGAAAEHFAFRQSFLKKAVQQALYVDTRRLATDTFVRNAASAVAAGLAATWALVAQLPTQIKDLPPGAQTLLLAAPILAYVAKDRIKELTRDWLARRVRAFDVSSEIAVGSLAEAGLGSFCGRVQERVRFCDPTEVPKEVLALRLAQRTMHGADLRGEGVLVYKRRLDIQPASDSALKQQPKQQIAQRYKRLGLRQIVRLNLRHFLTRLDEPKQQEFHYSSVEDRFVHAALPKVYHINLVARLSTLSGAAAPPALRRWRIVLNKKGIVRLEPVA